MISGKTLDAEQDPIHELAADWFARLHDAEISVEEAMEWQALMASNAEFARAYARIEEVWSAFADLNPTFPKLADEPADRYDGSVPIARWQPPRPRQWPRPRLLPLSLAASVAVAAVAGIFALLSWVPAQQLKTPAGQNQAFILSDGSRVNLGADTRLEIRMTRAERHINLIQGEAFFAVAKDRSRPFVVQSGLTSVTAVGTEFSVNRGRDQVLVAVVEGRVKVSANDPSHAGAGDVEQKQLDAGEQILVNAQASPVPQRLGKIAVSIGWQGNRLAFQSEPLSRVLEDVNRYSPKRIAVDDPSLGDLMITGTLVRDDVGTWLKSLEQVFPVRVIDGAQQIIIRSL